MILRHCLVAAALLLCSYSYSEVIQGTTSNAVGPGLTWQMPNVLPPQTGLTVNGITYRYSTIKNPEDPMSVTIQNENAIEGGYLFKKTDDWSGVPGNTITNSYPLENIPYEYWGSGEIYSTGNGSIENPSVVYNYRYDTCYDPMSDPRCPGYRQSIDNFINDYSLVNPLDDENIKRALDNNSLPDDYNDLKENNTVKKDGDKKKKRLNIAKNSLLTAEAMRQAALLEAMNNLPNFDLYYLGMPGGVYNDVQSYQSAQIPDSRQGLRIGYAQEELHRKMVEMQYKR